MLLFRSEEHVARWCAFRELPRGDVMSPEQCWRLALAWHGDKLRPDWRRLSLDEVEAALAEADLSGPFWRLRG